MASENGTRLSHRHQREIEAKYCHYWPPNEWSPATPTYRPIRPTTYQICARARSGIPTDQETRAVVTRLCISFALQRSKIHEPLYPPACAFGDH